jgi:hypothetical protein
MSTPNQLFTNNAVALLAAPISQIATSLTVMSGYGVLFPQPVDPGDFFLVTLENQTGTTREILRVNGRSGDTFTNIVRGQEGTSAQMWQASLGNDTLVDHRVTAETMRQALLQPVNASTPASLIIQDEGVPLAGATDIINFVGADVTVTGAGSTKTVTITNAGGAGDISGATTLTPVTVDPAWTIPLSSVIYSQYQRGFKFFVTILMPSNFLSCTFEVLGNISGDLAANGETVTWNRTARVGYNFAGSINITLNQTTKVLNLVWTNGEANTVEVLCTRIQHLP